MKYIEETFKVVISEQWLANKEEVNYNIKEIKKQKKKEPKYNNNIQSIKHKETEIEEKGQLPITRNKNKERKDKWKQRKYKHKKDKSKNRINKTIKKDKNYINKFQSILS